MCLGIEFFSGLREGGKPNFLDKVNCGFLASLAGVQFMSGRPDEARASLERAKGLSGFFDSSPSYNEDDIRFISRIDGASAHDDIGATAFDAINNVVKECENEEFTSLWISVTKGE